MKEQTYLCYTNTNNLIKYISKLLLGDSRKKKTKNIHHVWHEETPAPSTDCELGVLQSSQTWQTGGRSVYRVTNVLHHSVKLLRLVGVQVVGGVIDQLHKDRERKRESQSGAAATPNSTINQFEPSDANLEQKAHFWKPNSVTTAKRLRRDFKFTHQHFGISMVPDVGHLVPRGTVHPRARSVHQRDGQGGRQHVDPLQHGSLGPAQRLSHGPETHLATGEKEPSEEDTSNCWQFKTVLIKWVVFWSFFFFFSWSFCLFSPNTDKDIYSTVVSNSRLIPPISLLLNIHCVSFTPRIVQNSSCAIKNGWQKRLIMEKKTKTNCWKVLTLKSFVSLDVSI